ncbi:MAG: glycoside hydrolase family 3 C-terminal domain-containing protein [Alphaproteobacteria bacterium]
MGAVQSAVDGLVKAMTLDEKVALVTGADLWRTKGVPRLGIPPFKVSDGPNGVRGETLWKVASTCFPVGVALGASFNPDLVAEIGAAIGEDARDKDVLVVLGPTINLQRTPIGGRNFECYSEDPVLTGLLAAAFVSGVQSQGVGACPKHFVGNDTEVERHIVDSRIGPRALRELYLLPFEMAVKAARPWMIMSAYNRVNGIYASSHDALVNGVLKDEWGFDGVVVSDWGAALETVPNALGGLDLEMPGPGRVWGTALEQAVRGGAVPMAVLDDKVRRLITLQAKAGRLSGLAPRPERAEEKPGHRALAYRAAVEATVLLKNEGVLPFDPAPLRSLAVIGPNAARGQIQGGGSAGVRPHYERQPLEALQERLGGRVTIRHEPGCLTHKYMPFPDAGALQAGPGRGAGWWREEYATADLSGRPVSERLESRSFVSALGSGGGAAGGFRLTAAFTAQVTGEYRFGIASAGFSRLYADDILIVDNWDAWEPGETFFSFGSTERTGTLQLSEGQTIRLRIDFAAPSHGLLSGLRFGVLPPVPEDLGARAVDAARSSDAVVLVLGTNSDWETEGNDRETMALPGDQAALAAAVLAANPKTAVVVNAGSPVDMPWIDAARAVMVTWFAGQEFGTALADMLLGNAEPSGRLPLTIPRRLEDTPAWTHYPAEQGVMTYGEDQFMGYRWYDERDMPVLFPFGHGLGYGEIALEAVRVPPKASHAGPFEVEFDLRNGGDRTTTEVFQIYRAVDSGLRRPPKAFATAVKVTLAPGEARTVLVPLDPAYWRQWDEAGSCWLPDLGPMRLLVGRSSQAILAEAVVTLTE